jgi:hypothetical protein
MQNLAFYIKGRQMQKIFKNKVLRRIFGPIREEATGAGRKLDNEGLHNLYSSPNIIRTIKLRKIRWTRCRTALREAISYENFVGKPKAKRHL